MTMFFAKKLNKKGFTLAELLIVVAIIAILVAIAVPIFNNSLIKTRYAVHNNNGRAFKSLAIAELLLSKDFGDKDIKPEDKFIATGYYDFDTEDFVLQLVTTYSGDKEVGMWCSRTEIWATPKPADLHTWKGNGGWVQFTGEGKELKTIGSYGTSQKTYYVVIFRGIDVSDSTVSFT